jgi:hypothetical protein
MKYLLFCQPLRSKVLLLLFAIQEVFHGLKLMSIKLIRTSWIGCKLCLAFRKDSLYFLLVIVWFILFMLAFCKFTFRSLIFCQLLTCRQIVFRIRGNIWFYFLLTYIYEEIRRLINNPRFCSVNIQPLSWSHLKILTFLLVSQHLSFFCSCWCSFYFLWNLPLPLTWFLLQLDDNALNDVMKRLFTNYKKWCKYLGRKSSLWWLS